MHISTITKTATIFIKPEDVLAISDSTASNAGSLEASVEVNIKTLDKFNFQGSEREILRVHKAEPHIKIEFNSAFQESLVKQEFVENKNLTVVLGELTKSDSKVTGVATSFVPEVDPSVPEVVVPPLPEVDVQPSEPEFMPPM